MGSPGATCTRFIRVASFVSISPGIPANSPMRASSATVAGTKRGLIPAPAPAKPVPPLFGRLRRAYGSCRYRRANGRAPCVAVVSPVPRGARARRGPGRLRVLRVRLVRELAADLERRRPRRGGADPPRAPRRRTGRGQVGSPRRLPGGGRASAPGGHPGAPGGDGARDRAARPRRGRGRRLRRGRGRAGDAEPLLVCARALGRAGGGGRRERAALVQAA